MSNHPIIAALKAALESEIKQLHFDEQKLLEMSKSNLNYPQGDSEAHVYAADYRIGFRFGYTRGKKDAHEAATERLMTIIESLVSCLERYESLKSYPSMSVDRFGNKFMSVNDLGKDARKVLSTLADAGVIKKESE